MAETPEPRPPRIPPLPRSEWGKEEIAALDPMIPPPGSVYAERRKDRGGAGGVNALALLVRHPGLARSFLGFNRHILYESGVDERSRELLVLRLSWRYGSDYEWAQHVPVARQVGITADEIDRVMAGPDAPGWSAFDAAVLRATDSLLEVGNVDDDTWAILAEQWDLTTLLDFVFTVGGYATLAMAFNAADLPLDDGLEGFPRDDK